MKINRRGGFTLIEVIVVAGIIAILAGILVPMIFKEIDESKNTRAAGDIRSISSAIFVLKKDTGQWPVNASCTPAVKMLIGAGTVPAAAGGVTGWDTSTIASIDDYVMADDNGCWPATWSGPYIASVTMDPWGHAYILNADQFSTANSPVWILSAGPNGVINTQANSVTLVSDDIGLRIK